MPTLTVIVGLPGSGKSWNCDRLDPKHFNDLFHPSHRYGPGGIAEVVARLKDRLDCVAEDSYFCAEGHRSDFESWLTSIVPDVAVRWVFFENSPEKCLTNILGDRDAGKHGDFDGRLKAFANLYRRYTIPDGLPVQEVYCAYPQTLGSLEAVEQELAKHGL